MKKPVLVRRQCHFNAAHRLHNPNMSDEWNKEMFGPCNHEHYHGHNYVLEVEVKGDVDPDTGYVCDLGKLRDCIEEKILSRCDHKNLNLDVDFLEGVIPSSENLVIAFWEQLADALPSGTLHCVRLFETPRNVAEYYGPEATR